MTKVWQTEHPLWLLVAALITMTAIATTAAAQRGQMGGIGITAYADRDFRGASASFRHDVADLGKHGLDDKVSSLRVAAGEQWEVCEHSNYKGRCIVISGDEPELIRNAWSDIISSVRRIDAGAPAPAPRQSEEEEGERPAPRRSDARDAPDDREARAEGPAEPTGAPRDWYIVLYEQPTYGGFPSTFKGGASDVRDEIRRVRSVTIGRGVWQLCERPNFSGRCVTIDWSVSDLRLLGMRNGVASVRPVVGNSR